MTNQSITFPSLMTAADIASVLKCDESKVHKLHHAGLLTGFQMFEGRKGRRWLAKKVHEYVRIRALTADPLDDELSDDTVLPYVPVTLKTLGMKRDRRRRTGDRSQTSDKRRPHEKQITN